MKLKPCPCGKIPENLNVSHENSTPKWATVTGDCCGEWQIEFRNDHNDVNSKECLDRAIEAWNNAPQVNQWIKTSVRLPEFEARAGSEEFTTVIVCHRGITDTAIYSTKGWQYGGILDGGVVDGPPDYWMKPLLPECGK